MEYKTDIAAEKTRLEIDNHNLNVKVRKLKDEQRIAEKLIMRSVGIALFCGTICGVIIGYSIWCK